MNPQTQPSAISQDGLPAGTGRRCGVECGASGAKMVQLKIRKSGITVEGVFVEEEPFAARAGRQGRHPLEILHQLAIHRNLSGCKAVLIPDDAADSCFVILPRMNRSDVEGALLLQAKKALSWEREDEPVIAHMDSDFQHDRLGSIVALADWKGVKPWYALLEGSGGTVDDVTVRAAAFLALSQHQRLADSFPIFLIADIGAAASGFYILDKSSVRFMRKIPVAGDDITKALTCEISTEKGTLRLNETQAEEYKISGNLLTLAGQTEDIPQVSTPELSRQPSPPRRGGRTGGARTEPAAADSIRKAPPRRKTDYAKMMVRPVVERISSEIMRSIQFFQSNSGQTVAGVFLTGGSSSLPALINHLRSTISIPVGNINPFSGLRFASSEVEEFARKHRSRLAVAVGLALPRRTRLSLLPASVRAAKRFAAFAPAAVAALLILGFLPLLSAVIYSTVQKNSVAERIRDHKEQLANWDVQQQKIQELQSQVVTAQRDFQALRQFTSRDPLWAGILNTLADAASDDIVLARFATAFGDKGQAMIKLDGQVLSTAATFNETVAAFVTRLSSSVFFSGVHLIRATGNRTDDVLGTFEIQCDLAL